MFFTIFLQNLQNVFKKINDESYYTQQKKILIYVTKGNKEYL